MADKTSFLMYHRHLELFKQLSDAQAGILIKAVMEYEINGTIPNFGQDALLIGFFFGVFKPYLDENKEEYEKKCKKNSANVKKRWTKNTSEKTEEPKVEPNTDNTNVYERIPTIQTNTIYTDRIGKDRIGEDRIGEEEEKEEEKNSSPLSPSSEDASPSPSLDITPIIDFYNQNIGCCTAHIKDCLNDTAREYGIPNTLRACQLACERGKRTIGYIDATAKGLFTTGEFKQESKDVQKAEPYSLELERIAEEKFKDWGDAPSEFEEVFLDGTG